jgi:hypothetical protein
MAKGSRGRKGDALHPLVIRADEEQEQEAFLSDIIAKMWAASKLAECRGRPPFPDLHRDMEVELLTDQGRFFEQYIPLVAGLTGTPGTFIPQPHAILNVCALRVPALSKQWFMDAVDEVLESVGLSCDLKPHPNRQYVELAAHLLLWPTPVGDAADLVMLPCDAAVGLRYRV